MISPSKLKETIGKLSGAFMFMLLLCWLCQCEQPSAPDTIKRPVDLHLGNTTNRYINLDEYDEDTVTISGSYTGDRLVISNAQHKVLHFQECTINSLHQEDAIAFQGLVEHFTLLGEGLSMKGGGITFWGPLYDVNLLGGMIDSTHTGIRATQDYPHRNITVSKWNISNTTHEGIYLGISTPSPTPASGFIITGNTFKNCGWDAIQVGNVKHALISGNTVNGSGLSEAYGQDYGITVNPNSLAFIWDNTITNTKKPVQILDSRAFFHAPDAH